MTWSGTEPDEESCDFIDDKYRSPIQNDGE